MATGPPTDPDASERALRAQVKDALRQRIRAIRKTLPAEAHAKRSAAIAERVLALPELAAAETIAAFVAIHREVDPRAIVEAAWARGKRVALPRIDVEAQRIVLHLHAPGAPLEPSAFGVPEPLAEAPRVAPDAIGFVLVPALAVDPRGHRIGYGKGFYDRLLPTLPRAVSCAVAFDFQLVSEVPELPGDHAVDLVVTDARTLRRERS